KRKILNFARFPQTIKEVLLSKEVKNIPYTYLPRPKNFKAINKLNYPLYGLTSFWDNEAQQWNINFIDFQNDSILYTWFFLEKDFEKAKISYSNSCPKQSILLSNKNLIGRLSFSPNLFRLGANSNILWHNKELLFHHGVNLAADGNIWTCARDIYPEKKEEYYGGLVKNLDDNLISYREENIVKIDIETGAILFKKGIAEILIENGYKGIIYGSDLFDPTHLNDVQPALKDTRYWKKDDLFISIRNRSLVFLYRPSTNKILKLIHGPYVNQHDVDIISDHQISIFNNNNTGGKGYNADEIMVPIDSFNSSEVIIYDFETNTFTNYLSNRFQVEKIATASEGLSEFLNNGDLFVEEHNKGVYYIINEDEIVLKKIFPTKDPNYIYLPNWIRLYEDYPF
ncbi:MAG: arylsulfotransferase family protein, partial [Chitinophagales bacterium]